MQAIMSTEHKRTTTPTRAYRRHLERAIRAGRVAVVILGDKRRYVVAAETGRSVYCFRPRFRTVDDARRFAGDQWGAEATRRAK